MMMMMMMIVCLFGGSLQQYYGLCSLEIGHVRREDAGLYTVTATNPRGTISCSGTLDVQSKYDTFQRRSQDFALGRDSGVATGWTGVDMSTPLLPEVIPEIDANPMTFMTAREGERASVSGSVWHMKFMG